jgi:hypothetical protein
MLLALACVANDAVPFGHRILRADEVRVPCVGTRKDGSDLRGLRQIRDKVVGKPSVTSDKYLWLRR